ncbi:uncharacterized protein N7511_001383 [Penicillium nucicola]|uniref:uncharacterized protein n=1 Tax=Penicillium nucicola TaxID=1850975 RepID=UPI0025456FE5|nr:uncharacterized protein N7511_001383 [Penicillium nucicola]KAJ5776372.1 hypothetical protein N7511_001383 [Penicillium nucicola]
MENTRKQYLQPEAEQEIIGMCLNTTPVRVQVEPTAGVRDLLTMIQQQHIEALEHETIDWLDMVANSTSWAADNDLDSVVLHENVKTLQEIYLGNTAGQMHEPIFKDSNVKQHLLITFPCTQSLTTFLITRTGLLEKSFAEGLVSKFNDTLVRF